MKKPNSNLLAWWKKYFRRKPKPPTQMEIMLMSKLLDLADRIKVLSDAHLASKAEIAMLKSESLVQVSRIAELVAKGMTDDAQIAALVAEDIADDAKIAELMAIIDGALNGAPGGSTMNI